MYLVFKPLQRRDFFLWYKSVYIPWDLVFRTLLPNFKRVITAFRTSLIIKEDWSFRKVFCFVGANLFKTPIEIVWNNSDWLPSMFFSFSSFKSSVRNRWLEKFLKSRYKNFLGSNLLKSLFNTVKVSLRRSDNPVSIRIKFWELFWLLVNISSMHVGLSRFLKYACFLIRFLRVLDSEKTIYRIIWFCVKITH